MKKILLFLLLIPVLVLAQEQQSENFRIISSVIATGGGEGTSENFSLVSAFGQPTPVGLQSSESFVNSAGFLYPTFAVSPLSPIQDLVIRFNYPHVNLNWSGIPGANSYAIYRSENPTVPLGPSTLLAVVSDTCFTDQNINLIPAFRNYYSVTAGHTESLLSKVSKTQYLQSQSNASAVEIQNKKSGKN